MTTAAPKKKRTKAERPAVVEPVGGARAEPGKIRIRSSWLVWLNGGFLGR